MGRDPPAAGVPEGAPRGVPGGVRGGVPGREAGFLLLEALVAFVIAALALVVVFQGAADGLRVVRTAGRVEEAVARARSHLAAIGTAVKLRPGVQEGDDGSAYRWRVKIRTLAVSYPDGQGREQGQGQAGATGTALYDVTVTVSWTEAGRAQAVRLDSRRVGAAPPRRV